MKAIRNLALCLALGMITVSCEKESETMDELAHSKNQQAVAGTSVELNQNVKLKTEVVQSIIGENLRDYMVINNAVVKTECGPTEFVSVQNKYIGMLGKELVPALGGELANDLFGLYMDISFVAAYVDQSDQYFGEKGEYTNFMVKRQRELEGFWKMPDQIRVNGQHNAALNDLETVTYILYNYFVGWESEEEIYETAELIISLNAIFTTLPESPFFSVDGFATSGNLIVIGDGLVQMVSESGVSADIVWTGVLAHEWAHQIQFDNMKAWYPDGVADNRPEATRYTELEADFMAAYYMTHKRGATYNWKRVEQFFTLFFQIGDCGFTSDGHHGTPDQRMAAARLGYELANQAQKQGHILSPDQVHEAFVRAIATVL